MKYLVFAVRGVLLAMLLMALVVAGSLIPQIVASYLVP